MVFARKFRDWPRKYWHFGLISWWIKLQRSVSNDPRINVVIVRNCSSQDVVTLLRVRVRVRIATF